MDAERLYCELRAEGDRGVAGTAVRYGDVGLVHHRYRERFEPGAIEVRTPALVNREHRFDQALAVAEFTDTGEALEFRAVLPLGERQDKALADVASGKLKGLSVEFTAIAERWDGDTRVIERALVTGAALTKEPIYPASVLEMRSARLEETPAQRPARALPWL